ncbi:ParA family protein [Pediococcus pentosaceus]|uniref:ParA family protein n=1 Tax=Pediococcus pentosaceus TaxID=1255 RepID=UPI0020BE36E1|nr:AAA family ATPase [Pediococcus pentosaceus]
METEQLENVQHNAKVISFINMKGGVGKTTLCIGLGEYLANYANKKILFVDMDPQFNTTQSVMDLFDLTDEYMNNYRKNKSVREIFKDTETVSEIPKLPNPEDIIINLSGNDEEKNMSIICGSIDLIKDDDSRKSKFKRLNKFLSQKYIKENFDYVFIDCPPTISFYTDAALFASQYYVIPTKIDRYSVLGVQLLYTVIKQLQFDEDKTLKSLGVIYTNLPSPLTKKSKEIKEIFEKEESIKGWGVFTNSTHLVNDLMVGKQGNFSSHYKKSRKDIKRIAIEFTKKFGDDIKDEIESNEKK